MALQVEGCWGKTLRLILAILGVEPLANPTASVPELRFRSKSIFTLLCLLCATYPIVLMFDLVLSNSAEVVVGSSKLSRKIILYLLIPFNAGPNLIIRLSNLVNCQEMIDLIRDGLKIRDMLTTAGFASSRLSKGQRTMVGFYFAFCTIVCSRYVVFWIAGFAPTKYKTSNYALLPQSALIRPVVILLVTIVLNALLFFSVTFVIVAGSYLLHIQDGLCRVLEAQFNERFEATGHTILDMQVTQSHSYAEANDDSVFHSYVKFPVTFRSVKSLFQSYLSIAGWHSLALTFLGAMGIIKGLSTIMIDPGTRLANCMLVMESLTLLVLLSCFGDYFKESILSSQRKIEDLAGNEQSEDVKWYLGWKVELTARNFFTVHHPLILHVVTVVVTFFIFMFQLKLNEDADASGVGYRYNSTAGEIEIQ